MGATNCIPAQFTRTSIDLNFLIVVLIIFSIFFTLVNSTLKIKDLIGLRIFFILKIFFFAF
jgi:hypothetical protein